MQLLKNFAKIFDLEEGQLLMTKDYDSEGEKHCIKIDMLSIVDESYAASSITLGYDSIEKRDADFDNSNTEWVSNFVTVFTNQFEQQK